MSIQQFTAITILDNKAVLARTLPFFVFVILMAFEPVLLFLNIDSNWHYFIRALAALLLLLFFRRQYAELIVIPNKRDVIIAILSGFFVFLIWIMPYPNFLGAPPDRQFSKVIVGNYGGFLLFVRLFGSALIVPLIEELFWRSYLIRRLDQVHFEHLEPKYISLLSVVIGSVLFASEHQLWLAGLIAGLTYSFLYIKFQNLWLPIVAHITTNSVLGVWVFQFEHWEYW